MIVRISVNNPLSPQRNCGLNQINLIFLSLKNHAFHDTNGLADTKFYVVIPIKVIILLSSNSFIIFGFRLCVVIILCGLFYVCYFMCMCYYILCLLCFFAMIKLLI